MHQPLNLTRPPVDGFNDVARAEMVASVEFLRPTRARQSGAMDDVGDAIQRPRYGFNVVDRTEANIELRQMGLDETTIRGFAQENGCGKVLRQQTVHDVAAHEPVRAGDQDFHARRPRIAPA